MLSLVNSNAHSKYATLYDEYKVASCAVFVIPYGVVNPSLKEASYATE